MEKDKSQKKRILVVEDEVSTGNLCRRVLGFAGLEVDVAVDGEKAQQMIQKQEYALFLIDLRLPVLSGRELYGWLKDTYPSSATKVIFMTGSTANEATAEFLKSAGRPVLLKPFSVDQLESMVKETLRQVEGWQ